jgi:hypothetical protein
MIAYIVTMASVEIENIKTKEMMKLLSTTDPDRQG